MKGKPPQKIDNVLDLARNCIENDNYIATFHAENRQLERDITLLDALHVIKNGYREQKNDQYKDEWQAWNYAIRGETLQKDTVRVIISFDEMDTRLLIITVINIVRRE